MRDILFTTQSIEEHINSAILYKETFDNQKMNRKSFIDYLKEKGTISEINVDADVAFFKTNNDETATKKSISERNITVFLFCLWQNDFIK